MLIRANSTTPPSMIEPLESLTGCVAYWDFRDGSLLDVIDNETITNVGATVIDDHLGYKNCAYHFDGVDDKMINIMPQLPVTSDFTIFTIVKRINNSRMYIFDNEISCLLYPSYRLLVNEHDEHDDKLHFYLYYNTSSFILVKSNHIFENDETVMICVTYDHKSMKLYINGILDNSIETSVNPNYINNKFYSGALQYKNNPYWIEHSEMDMYLLMIYERAISDTEVAELSKILSYKYIYPIPRMERK